MILSGELKFKGKDALRWLSQHKDGSVDLLFDCGNEISLNFERDCFETIVKLANSFLLGAGKSVHNLNEKAGSLEANLDIWMKEGKTSIDGEWDEDEMDGTDPFINISCGKESVDLCFNEAQAKELKDRCEKFIEIRRALKEAQKKRREIIRKKTIPADPVKASA